MFRTEKNTLMNEFDIVEQCRLENVGEKITYFLKDNGICLKLYSWYIRRVMYNSL